MIVYIVAITGRGPSPGDTDLLLVNFILNNKLRIKTLFSKGFDFFWLSNI